MDKKTDLPFAGIDLGGTNISAGIIAADNRVLARRKRKTKAQLGGDAVIERMVETLREVLEEAGLSRQQVGGVGVGGPGAIDVSRGLVLNAPNLGWRRFQLAGVLQKALKMPVAVDNDVNVAVYAEVVAGAARDYDDVLGIWTGTGVGGAIVLGRRLFYGHHLTAGEIGHTILFPGAQLGRRTLENCASRTAIARLIVDLIQSNHPSRISAIVQGDYEKVRSKVIAQALAEKDELTTRVVREAARLTAAAAANLVTVLSLPCVLLGGGFVTELGTIWADWVREFLVDFVFPSELREVRILESKLGDDAGMIGAGIVARERLVGTPPQRHRDLARHSRNQQS